MKTHQDTAWAIFAALREQLVARGAHLFCWAVTYVTFQGSSGPVLSNHFQRRSPMVFWTATHTSQCPVPVLSSRTITR